MVNHAVRRNNPRRSRSRSRGAPSTVPSFQPVRARNNAPGRNIILRNVEKWIDKGILTSTSLAAGFYAFQFVLQDIPDSSQFTSIFDQYRLTRVDVRVIPMTQHALPAGSSAISMCWVATDFDDSAAPSSVAQVQNYSNALAISPGSGTMFSFKPMIETAVQQSGGAIVAGGVAEPWLNCSQPNIPHFGVKVAITQSTSTNVNYWYIIFRYHVAFRSAR